LRLTGHFLARDAFGNLHRPLPQARTMLYDRVAAMVAPDETTAMVAPDETTAMTAQSEATAMVPAQEKDDPSNNAG
jgi:hypothetical protein